MKISNMIDAGELIEDGDWTVLDKAAGCEPMGLCRVSQHQHGYIMFVNPAEVLERVESMISYGFSRELTEVYQQAVANGCILINFDVG